MAKFSPVDSEISTAWGKIKRRVEMKGPELLERILSEASPHLQDEVDDDGVGSLRDSSPEPEEEGDPDEQERAGE